MNKVKVTQKQIDTIISLKAKYGNNIYRIRSDEDVIRESANVEFSWESDEECLNDLDLSDLIHILYVPDSYEIEPKFIEGDCVVYEGMHPKLIGRIVNVEGELRVDTPRYKVPQSLPTSKVRLATKQEIWWFENDRDVWQLKYNDTLIDITGSKREIDHVDNGGKRVKFKLPAGSAARPRYHLLEEIEKVYRVFCFVEDRKDI